MSTRWTAARARAFFSAIVFSLVYFTTSVAFGQTLTYPYPGTGANPPTNPTVPTTLTITYSGCGSTSPAPQNTTEYVEAPFQIAVPLDAFDVTSWAALGTINESEALTYINGVSQAPSYTNTQTIPTYVQNGITVQAQQTYNGSVSGMAVTESLIANITENGNNQNQTANYTITSTYNVASGVQNYSYSYSLHGTSVNSAQCTVTTDVEEQGSTTVNWLGAPPPSITTSLPSGKAGASYGPIALITGGSGTYTSILTPGLPPGLNVSSSGVLSGMLAATDSGTYNLVVSVTDADGQTAGPTPDPISISAAASCTVPPVPFQGGGASWSQAALPWGSQPYDHANGPKNSIQSQGCKLTALAYAMTAAGQPIDPLTLNSKLDGIVGAYSAPDGTTPNSGGRIDEETAVIQASNNALKVDYTNADNPTTTDALDANLCATTPRPVIIQVPSSGVSGMHFVVVTGKVGNSYSILDPGHSANTSISVANLANTSIMGVVKPPEGTDPSALDISLLNNATLLVTAPDGSQTGLDTSTGKILKGAAGSAYSSTDNSIDTDTDTEAATETMYSVHSFLPANGTYIINVEGLKLGPYSLVIQALDVNGKQLTHITLPGIANVGSTTTYQVKFSAAPGSTNTVTSMTTFASTLADISNGFKASLITKQPITEALTDLIRLAQDASYRNDRFGHDLERAALGVFKQLVTFEANRHITGTEPQVLLNDASYLISQIPSNGKAKW